jgi:CDP-diacylglycerol---serine O-phosphatidyltransferase
MSAVWIPNTLTLGSLTCGFVSVVYASRSSSEGSIVAAVLILLAALLDGLDGQVARRLGLVSPMGKELDSLADCVTFGIAPGYLAYQTYLGGTSVALAGHPIDLGILIAAVFPVCAAYRLARYNVRSSPGSFTGLPSTIAGSLVALAPLSFYPTAVPKLVFTVLFLFVGFLMVSTVSYSKPQAYLLKNWLGFKVGGFIALFTLLLLRFGSRIIFLFLFLFVAVYVLSGLLGYIIKTIEEHRY